MADTHFILTETQAEVMKWLRGGWRALQNRGEVVEINGKKVCTGSTMRALLRKGLVEKEDEYYWKATSLGKSAQIGTSGGLI